MNTALAAVAAQNDRILAKKVQLLASHLPVTASSGTVVAAMAVVGSWPVVDHRLLLGWLGVYVVTVVLRLWQGRLYWRDPLRDDRPSVWAPRLTANFTVSGLLWFTFGLIAFVPDNMAHTLFIAVVQAGMTAASLASLSAYRPAHLGFALPTMLGVALPFLLSGQNSLMLLGVMALMFLLVNALSGRSAERVLTDSLRLRFDNERLIEELARSNAELEQFAYIASHDMREPLRQVASYVNLIDRKYGPSLDDTAREFLAFARDGATRMDRLILDLLEYSRIGRAAPAVDAVPLDAVVDEVLAALSVAIADGGGAVTVQRPLPVVRGEHGNLVRLFQNLIGNAVKYRDPERPPHVDISARLNDGEAIITVRDNGIGFPDDQRERIFDIFLRLHDRQHYDGTGIGLAVCRKVVEHHGGRIWADGVPGQGAAFHVALKLSPQES